MNDLRRHLGWPLLLCAIPIACTVRKHSPEPAYSQNVQITAPLREPVAPAPHSDVIPGPRREFRAAWVATVANIDWPSKPGLDTAQQRLEARAILDRLVALRMNAVILQVRPQADAMYPSRLEPWSYYLTGQQGKAPTPAYDPLEFWIDEAHARGLALHAWFNPYRANHPANKGALSERSIVKTNPELVVELGSNGYYWMVPSMQAVQDHSIAVVMDVVRRYDIDGVHFDDYFYPYPSYNDNRDFPDDTSWARYRQAGGQLSRSDWRRAAVDTFVERLHHEIKQSKPHVAFGISPFGIWRPGHPPSIRGLDQYEVLYADARRWLNEGWVDYFMPQLYWPIAQIPQSFPVLLGWWARENSKQRHLWPGTTLSRMRDASGATEIVNQIMITRGMFAERPGLCMFSMKRLMNDEHALGERLRKGPYERRALLPASPWMDADAPDPPRVRVALSGGEHTITWTPARGEPAFVWVVYWEVNQVWQHAIVPGRRRSFAIPKAARGATRIAVSSVDRMGNESRRAVVDCASK